MDTADFFDDDYQRILAPFHPEAEARRETAGIREILGLAQDDRILDLACGWGRHLRLLEQAGHDVTGVDLSVPLLTKAARAPETSGTTASLDGRKEEGARNGGAGKRRRPPRLVAADMLLLPFMDATFDVVLNLATSLGLFIDDGPAVRALREARRVLRPGGRLLIEGMHRDDVVANFAPRDQWVLEDGTEVRARRRFDAVAGVSHEVVRWMGPEGGGTKRHSLRLRTATELAGLLESAGLGVHAVYGGWEQERFGRESERVIVVALAARR